MATPEQTPQDPKEYWQGFPEAPYSDSFKWTDEQGFEHLSTVRAWTGKNLLTGIDKMVSNIIDLKGKPINGKPQPAPVAGPAQIQLKTEDGTPVIDAETRQPVMVNLPSGHHLFTVKEVYHDKTQSGKDNLKIVLEEKYEFGNGKYGVSCFHPNGFYNGWKDWEVGKRFAPSREAAKVIIRDPKEGGKYADVVEFRPA